MSKIKVGQLEVVFNLILEKLRDERVDNIEIDEDMYWEITSSDWSIENKNPEMVVGSLKDDWESLEKCINKNEILSYVEFDRLASVLRAISQKLSPV